MNARNARRLLVIFFAFYTLALTFPGMIPFNRVHPFVFGLPFSIFWVTLWVALSGLALALAWRAEPSGDTEE